MKHLRNTFSAKLILLLIFVIFMPMAILSTFISVKLYRSAVQNDSTMNQSNLESMSSNLNAYFKGFTHVTDSIFISETLQGLLYHKPETPYESLMADRLYTDTMRDITVNTYDIENIYLIAADGTDYFYNGNRYLSDIRMKCEEFSDIKSYDFPLLTGFSTNSYLTGNTPVYIAVIMQPLFNLDTREYLGMAVLQFHSNIFNKLLDYNTDTTMITDENKKIIYHSEGNYLNQSADTLFPDGLDGPVQYEDKNMLPSSISLENKYKLIQLKDYDAGNIKFFMETVPVIWIFFACTLVFILISILLAKRLTSPIKVLQNAMTTAWPEGLNSYVDIQTHDEFELLGKSYNHMLDQLNLFIEKSYNQEIQHLNAEFRALQSQINPHFLYNALENINSMAQIKHETEISRMVCCLADMFRYTTQQTEKLIPLRQEIQHVKNYYQLQNISCDNKVYLQYRVPDRLLDIPVPKLIIQPMIENCFNHGFDYSDKNLKISLSIEERNNILTIRVEDNGKGIPSGTLAEIQERLKHSDDYYSQSSSIGLININQRLKMIYQPGSGLEISSTPSKGTVVLLTLIERE